MTGEPFAHALGSGVEEYAASDHTARIVAALEAHADQLTANLHPAGAEYGRIRREYREVVAIVRGVS